MGTGIVSVALGDHGDRVASRVLLGLALAVWIGLVAVVVDRGLRDRRRLVREAQHPAALTAGAATAVLGSKFADLGWSAVAAAFLVLAAGAWLSCLGPVLGRIPRPATGTTFLLTVSTQSLAVLAAALASRAGAVWLEYLAAGLAAIGLLLYAIALVRFDPRQLLDGLGDQWVSGGALAITTLALAQITLAARALRVLGGRGAVLQSTSLAAWAAAASWLPVLIAAELARPRPRYYTERWATVFPLGMYGACSFTLGAAAGLPWLRDFATVWLWLAAAVWMTAAVGLMRQVRLCWLRTPRAAT
jgi:tellurite resistance protein TehA-like permease